MSSKAAVRRDGTTIIGTMSLGKPKSRQRPDKGTLIMSRNTMATSGEYNSYKWRETSSAKSWTLTESGTDSEKVLRQRGQAVTMV